MKNKNKSCATDFFVVNVVFVFPFTANDDRKKEKIKNLFFFLLFIVKSNNHHHQEESSSLATEAQVRQ